MIESGRKCSKRVGNGQKWVVIKMGYIKMYGVVRSGQKLSGVVGNDLKQPRLSFLINTHIVL